MVKNDALSGVRILHKDKNSPYVSFLRKFLSILDISKNSFGIVFGHRDFWKCDLTLGFLRKTTLLKNTLRVFIFTLRRTSWKFQKVYFTPGIIEKTTFFNLPVVGPLESF